MKDRYISYLSEREREKQTNKIEIGHKDFTRNVVEREREGVKD